MTTVPVYGELSHLACTGVNLRFKELRLQNMEHRISDVTGCYVILVAFNNFESAYTLTYVNSANAVLKRLSYAREAVIEVDMWESVCRLAAEVPVPTPIREVK